MCVCVCVPARVCAHMCAHPLTLNQDSFQDWVSSFQHVDSGDQTQVIRFVNHRTKLNHLTSPNFKKFPNSYEEKY